MKKQIVVCACGEPWAHPSDPFMARRTDDVELTRSGLTITMIKVPQQGAFQGPAFVAHCPRKKVMMVTL
jgi:hypothetical protein